MELHGLDRIPTDVLASDNAEKIPGTIILLPKHDYAGLLDVCIVCRLHQTIQEAKDFAGTLTYAYSWARFTFAFVKSG